jgi:hypothetical protein
MSFIEFPYTLHKGYLMPIIPIRISDHKIWVYVDSGAIFSMMSAAEATDMDIDWRSGRRQMVVIGDGSFIPVYLHNLSLHIEAWHIQAPIGFSERLGVGFNVLGRRSIFDQFQVCFNDRTRRVTFQKL